MKALLIIGFCLTPPAILYVVFGRPHRTAASGGDGDSHLTLYSVCAVLSVIVGLLLYGAAATLWDRRRKRP